MYDTPMQQVELGVEALGGGRLGGQGTTRADGQVKKAELDSHAPPPVEKYTNTEMRNTAYQNEKRIFMRNTV